MTGNPFFTCFICGETFVKSRSDAQALQEFESLWGFCEVEDLATVCGECFEECSIARLEEIAGISPKVN